jgi:hypothetical protein
MVEYQPCFEREFLLLLYLVNNITLAIYLLSITPPIRIVNTQPLSWIKTEGGRIVDEEKDQARNGVNPSSIMIHSSGVPGTVVEDVGPSLWRM